MKKIIYGLMSYLPVSVFAAEPTVNLGFLQRIVEQIGNAIRALIPVIFGLAVVYFFWGLAQYVRSAGDQKRAAEGKSIMIYGIIAIAVMASVWGLVAWLQGVTGVDPNSTIKVPSIIGL